MLPYLRARRLPRRRRFLTGWRRGVAALLLASAAGLTVDAVAARPPTGVPVLVASRDLPAGHRVGTDDLREVRVPAAAVPDGVLPTAELAGAVLSAPLRRGEPVTDARVGTRGLLTGAPPGTLAVPVPLADPAALHLVEPGSEVAVLAGPDLDGFSGAGEVLVPSAVVLAVRAGDGGSLLGAAGEGASVVLALDRAEAVRVAAVAGRRAVTVAVVA